MTASEVQQVRSALMCFCGGHDARLAPREKDLLAHRQLSVVGDNLRCGSAADVQACFTAVRPSLSVQRCSGDTLAPGALVGVNIFQKTYSVSTSVIRT